MNQLSSLRVPALQVEGTKPVRQAPEVTKNKYPVVIASTSTASGRDEAIPRSKSEKR